MNKRMLCALALLAAGPLQARAADVALQNQKNWKKVPVFDSIVESAK